MDDGDLLDIRIDRSSSTWLSLRRVIRSEIEKLRDNLEQPFISEEQTAQYRGEIVFARRIIKTVEPDAPDGAGQPIEYSRVRAPIHES